MGGFAQILLRFGWVGYIVVWGNREGSPEFTVVCLNERVPTVILSPILGKALLLQPICQFGHGASIN